MPATTVLPAPFQPASIKNGDRLLLPLKGIVKRAASLDLRSAVFSSDNTPSSYHPEFFGLPSARMVRFPFESPVPQSMKHAQEAPTFRSLFGVRSASPQALSLSLFDFRLISEGYTLTGSPLV